MYLDWPRAFAQSPRLTRTHRDPGPQSAFQGNCLEGWRFPWYIPWYIGQNQIHQLCFKMSGGEAVLVKWGDFQENIKSSFTGLRGSSDFADVTLACEDGEVEAHKLILSACSPFFERLLKRYKHHQQQLIFMRGLKASQLMALIDYIYQGEVNILQEDLDGFLLIAEELELKGLLAGTGNAAEENNQSVSKKEVLPFEIPKEQGSEKNTRDKDQDMAGAPGGSKVEDEKEAEKTQILSEKAVTDFNNSEMDEYVNNMVEEELKKMPKKHPNEIYLQNVRQKAQQKTEAMYEQWFQGMWGCKVCGYTASTKNSLKRHTEKHLEGSAYPCSECGKYLKTSESLRLHYIRSHPLGSV